VDEGAQFIDETEFAGGLMFGCAGHFHELFSVRDFLLFVTSKQTLMQNCMLDKDL
jgi:hypothetical protein